MVYCAVVCRRHLRLGLSKKGMPRPPSRIGIVRRYPNRATGKMQVLFVILESRETMVVKRHDMHAHRVRIGIPNDGCPVEAMVNPAAHTKMRRARKSVKPRVRDHAQRHGLVGMVAHTLF